MRRMPRAGGDLRGNLAGAWIGCLGGLFVGALGQGSTLMPGGYYANGVVFGQIGGAGVGALVGLASGVGVARRFGNGRVALVAGLLGWLGAAVYGTIAFPLADATEVAFRNDPGTAGILAAILCAAVGGALAAAIRIGARPDGAAVPAHGRWLDVTDLAAGGILGAFFGLFSGAFADAMKRAWGLPSAWSSPGRAWASSSGSTSAPSLAGRLRHCSARSSAAGARNAARNKPAKTGATGQIDVAG